MREAKAQGAWASQNRAATAEDEERIAGLIATVKESIRLPQRANTPEDEERMMAALIGAKEEQHARTPEDEELEIAEATMEWEKKALTPVPEEEEPLDALKRAMRSELPTTRQRADTA